MQSATPATYNADLAYDRATRTTSPRPRAVGRIIKLVGTLAGLAMVVLAILSTIIGHYLLAGAAAFLSIGAFAMGGQQGVWAGQCPDCGSPIVVAAREDADNHALDCEACNGRLILRSGAFHSVRTLTSQ